MVDFPDAEGPLEFGYDEEWLAVLRGTHSLLSLRPTPVALPGVPGQPYVVILQLCLLRGRNGFSQ